MEEMIYENFKDNITKENFDLIYNKGLYHYTNLENFVKIIKEKKINLYDIKKMNDSQEILFLKKAIYMCAEKIYNEDKFEIRILNFINIEAINQILDEIFNFILYYPKYYFAFCLSEKRDSLSQWQAYGNKRKGICLEIGFQDLLNIAKKIIFN